MKATMRGYRWTIASLLFFAIAGISLFGLAPNDPCRSKCHCSFLELH
jgi:hypothetical protein